MENWNQYYGSRELTFAGLKHALQSVNTNGFICVWTDEIGDDTTNTTLRNDILSLKASTQSEIFIMAITKATTSGTSTVPPTISTNQPVSRVVRAAQGDKEDMDESKTRSFYTLEYFEKVFGGIGHVMDVTNDQDVVNKMVNYMKNSALCK